MIRKHQKKAPEPVSTSPGRYRVQLYSTRAHLVREFYLDADKHGLWDMEAAEDHLRRTLAPSDFNSTVSLTSDDGRASENILQFQLKRG